MITWGNTILWKQPDRSAWESFVRYLEWPIDTVRESTFQDLAIKSFRAIGEGIGFGFIVAVVSYLGALPEGGFDATNSHALSIFAVVVIGGTAVRIIFPLLFYLLFAPLYPITYWLESFVLIRDHGIYCNGKYWKAEEIDRFDFETSAFSEVSSSWLNLRLETKDGETIIASVEPSESTDLLRERLADYTDGRSRNRQKYSFSNCVLLLFLSPLYISCLYDLILVVWGHRSFNPGYLVICAVFTGLAYYFLGLRQVVLTEEEIYFNWGFVGKNWFNYRDVSEINFILRRIRMEGDQSSYNLVAMTESRTLLREVARRAEEAGEVELFGDADFVEALRDKDNEDETE